MTGFPKLVENFLDFRMATAHYIQIEKLDFRKTETLTGGNVMKFNFTRERMFGKSDSRKEAITTSNKVRFAF